MSRSASTNGSPIRSMPAIRPSSARVNPNATRTFPATAHTAPGSPSTSASSAPRARPDSQRATASVPDQIWDEAAKHFDEQGMASLVLKIAVTNVFNRLNRVTRQVVGAW